MTPESLPRTLSFRGSLVVSRSCVLDPGLTGSHSNCKPPLARPSDPPFHLLGGNLPPYLLPSSTLSATRLLTHALSSTFNGASREAAVRAVGAFAAVTVKDGVAVRRWMWMIGKAAREGIVSVSIRSSAARIARTFSCTVRSGYTACSVGC